MKKKEEEEASGNTVLVPAEKYLKTGAHIGTKMKTGEMKKYIYKQRPDGLKVLDVKTLDERIKVAGEMIARYEREKIVAVSRKLYGSTSVKKFAELIGAKAITGRFVPGTFTNPSSKEFFEPRLVIATEPESDSQAIEEANRAKAAVIGLCSTNNSTKNIDLVVPVNNKGRKSIALIYWILARETLKARKDLKKDSDFKEKEEDFEFQIKEEKEEKSEKKEGFKIDRKTFINRKQ